MRTELKSAVLCRGLVLVAVVCATSSLPAKDRIEAVAGKKYELSRVHGPVMIMVETFRRSANEADTPDKKTAEQVANELVFELRSRNNLPAYIYRVNADDGVVDTFDRRGNRDQKKNLHKVESFGVIAGNYPSLNDPLARDTLAFVKKLRPKCLSPESGIVWFAKAGEGPFQKAFLTVNPLLSEEEAESRMASQSSFDPLLIKLNSSVNHSLLENKGKFTLQVAMFTGRKVVEGTLAAQKTNFFEERVNPNPLAWAEVEANDLMLALRQHRKREAYVWHDHYQSIVTIGSYETRNDAQLLKDIELFKEKPQLNKLTNKMEIQPEHMWIDNTGPNKDTMRIWAFMPEPLVMPVPQMRPKSSPLARLPDGMRGR